MNKTTAYCIAGLAAFLAGCGEDPTIPPAPSEPAWRLMVTGEPLVDVWGVSPTAVYALGGRSLLFYNGSTWTGLPDPPSNGTAIWGTRPENLFVIVDVWQAGVHTDIYHYDGRAWEVVVDRPFTGFRLFDIWGSSDHDVFVVGEGGIILHYDGSAWSHMPSGKGSDLRCLWGTSSTDVYAAGSEGTVLHYDGSTWSDISTETSWKFSGIWASSSSDIYCVGVDPAAPDYDSGAIHHYNGSRWQLVQRGLFPLRNVWGSSSTDVFVVGDAGTVWHCDGVAWTPIRPGGPVWAGGIWGSSSHDVFIVGAGGNFSDMDMSNGSILHYDGTAWQEQATSLTQTSDIAGVGGSSATDVYFVGGSRGYPNLGHFNGASFDASVGLQGEYPWTDVWAASRDAVFVVGGYWRNGFRIDFFDGSFSEWTGEYAPAGHEWQLDSGDDITSVWAASRVDAFVACYNGALYHYDGSTWAPMATGTTSDLMDIWGSSETDVFAVGEAGTILHYAGSSWLPMPTETSNTLLGVWGSSSTDVYAVGDSGTILHYDGVHWKAVPSITQNSLTGVWGSSDRDVYVVGGVILHYDGQAWTTLRTDVGAHKVWGSGPGDVYVTDWNRILHYGVQ